MQNRRGILSLVVGVVALATTAASAQSYWFKNVTKSADLGIYQYRNRTAVYKPHPPGAAFVDLNNDDLPDLYLLQGEGIANQVMYNQGDGTFALPESPIGVESTAFSVSVGAADYNNDGYQDLYLGNEGFNNLFRNNGDGTFTDVTAEAGVDGGDGNRTYGTGWLDCNNDGWLDLYLGQWDGPDDRDRLLQSNGDGTFTDVTPGSGIFNDGLVLALAIADFDNDGNVDVYTANDVGDDHLFRGLGDCQFEDVTLAAGVGTHAGNAMGAAVGDYDNDGLLDIYLSDTMSNTFDEFDGLPLYHNDGNMTFTNVSESAGTVGLFGWGTVFGDFNNDGWQDIYLSAHAADFPVPDGLFVNDADGTFRDLGTQTGRSNDGNARGVAMADLHRDGKLDLFVANSMVTIDDGELDARRSALYYNTAPDLSWLVLELEGTTSNRDAIGARIDLRINSQFELHRQIVGAQSFCSSSEKLVHFGLGGASEAKAIDVHWPSGELTELRDVPAEQYVTVVEGAPIVLMDAPRPTTVAALSEVPVRVLPLAGAGNATLQVSVLRGAEEIARGVATPLSWGDSAEQHATLQAPQVTEAGTYRVVAEMLDGGRRLGRSEWRVTVDPAP